ncbi:SRF-type transcription factor (DNA-binding and dimerization domain) protein [Medicago truncatula]|uniref:SRF-type transcription factor (DNA-binding and dimerization domain) protein n=1 Tax=Medicago truncatula TaxID=3880 RepID=G7J0I1_MEDTR|nr:SRF-type transcription factor (DNA-binding and dimerization domain) protein [Medicago truncatula]
MDNICFPFQSMTSDILKGIRNGLLKKANDLSFLCDAEVSIILFLFCSTCI